MDADRIYTDLANQIARQDSAHPQGYARDRDGIRLGIATLEDQLSAVWEAWMKEGNNHKFPTTAIEVLQVAAVAMRMYRSLTQSPTASYGTFQEVPGSFREGGGPVSLPPGGKLTETPTAERKHHGCI